MIDIEDAIEVAAQRWHERSEEKDQKNAQRVLEEAERYRQHWGDEECKGQAYRDAKELVECGPMPWEECPEFGKEYARNQVRQIIVDAAPALLYAEVDMAVMFADGIHTSPDEKFYLRWTAGYLRDRAEMLTNESVHGDLPSV